MEGVQNASKNRKEQMSELQIEYNIDDVFPHIPYKWPL